ncbi:hypothetical protein ACLOAU_23075 [Niabella sp. CJ426]|uniref:hypothetical protein n=1 Tax=Niabella sp. CJ426 TaxID=3393740 RepID=UPI003D01BEAD
MNRYSIFFIYLILQVSNLTARGQQRELTNYKVDMTANGKVYIITQKKAEYKIDSARYAVFIPEGVTSINGILIHQHGCTMEGRGMATAYDVQYQAFAKKFQLAIVGPDLFAKNNCHDWKTPASGSADALLTTLSQISILAKIPSLKNVPWLLWGHSGGGYWSQAMMAAYPERVMALFSYSPGLDASFNYPKEAMQVPVMIRYAGPEGDACCWESAVRTFEELRKSDGMVSIALTRYQNHNYSFVRYMAIPFFESVMQQRMPEKPGAGFMAMRKIDRSKAWLGDTASLNIYSEKSYPGKMLGASWLPDSLTAVKWREFIVSGTIVDRTAPPAPYELQLFRRHNMTVELSWKADADIESGISHFNIYKGGHLVGRFPSSGVYQGFDTNGDDAYPLSLPELRTDISLPWNDSGKISISTVNHFGLESAKTELP